MLLHSVFKASEQPEKHKPQTYYQTKVGQSGRAMEYTVFSLVGPCFDCLFIIIHLESLFFPPDKCTVNNHTPFSSSPTPENLLDVPHVPPAGQLVHSGFI